MFFTLRLLFCSQLQFIAQFHQKTVLFDGACKFRSFRPPSRILNYTTPPASIIIGRKTRIPKRRALSAARRNSLIKVRLSYEQAPPDSPVHRFRALGQPIRRLQGRAAHHSPGDAARAALSGFDPGAPARPAPAQGAEARGQARLADSLCHRLHRVFRQLLPTNAGD